MRMELKKLHLHMKTTTIYVTHDQIEAMTLADKIVILKDGYIQQVGTPVEVFEKPANRFVASFIGNPPINIMPAQIGLDDTGSTISLGTLCFPVAVADSCYNGQKVLAGIRPDAVKAGNNLKEIQEPWRVTATVVVSEILGSQSLLEFTVGNTTMIGELQGRILARPGEEIELGLDLDHLLLFDPKTEEAIR